MVRRASLAAAFFLVCNAPALAISCDAAPPGRAIVVLKSTDLDPDVFVWDSRQRVADYAAGYWRDTRDVLAHTLLAKPGTHAQVVQCVAGFVRSRYAGERQDAVGIRILSGPSRGRYGWVTSEDVHVSGTAQR